MIANGFSVLLRHPELLRDALRAKTVVLIQVTQMDFSRAVELPSELSLLLQDGKHHPEWFIVCSQNPKAGPCWRSQCYWGFTAFHNLFGALERRLQTTQESLRRSEPAQPPNLLKPPK